MIWYILISTFQISIHFNTQVQLCAQILGSALRSRLLNAFLWIAVQQFLRRVAICVERIRYTVPLQGLLQDLETGDDVWVERDSACNSPTEAHVGSCFWTFCFFKATQKQHSFQSQYCKNLLMLTSEGKPMRLGPSKWVMLCRILPGCTWRTTKLCHLLLSALSYYIYICLPGVTTY